MESNAAGERLFPTPPERFPFVRRFGDVALDRAVLGHPDHAVHRRGQDRLGTARASWPTRSTGLSRRDLFRVVLIHHPPLRDQAGWHRGLRDAGRFTRVLKQHGAELVLHGHNHAQTVHELPTATGPAIVVGVPSASEAVEGRIPAARYNEYSASRGTATAGAWRWSAARSQPPDHVWESERRVLRKHSLRSAEQHRDQQPCRAGENADGEGRDHDAHRRRPTARAPPRCRPMRPGSTSAASIRSRRTISCAM